MQSEAGASEQQSALGQALLAAGVVTEEQLKRAMRVRGLLEEPKQLSEVVIDLGYATRDAVHTAIAQHGKHLRLGELLVEQSLITPETLDMALALQRERKIRLGEALIELGAINERTLLRNVAHQNRAPYIEPTFNIIPADLLRGVSPDYLDKWCFVPFSKSDAGQVTVVVPDLADEGRRQALDELFQGRVSLAMGPEDAIRQSIDDFRKFRKRSSGKEEEEEDERGPEDSVVPLVSHILAQGIQEGASDIHIEPMQDRIRLRYRIDGVLAYKTDLPLDLLPRIVSRLKIMAEINITEHQRHQGGRIEFEIGDKQVDLRLSMYVTVHGECAVLRILNKDMGLVSLDELGMNPSMLTRFQHDVLDVPTGVALITGPTGSGKTTTLYSSVDYCNDISRKIITAEDPVEYTIEGIIQCSINEKIGRTFEMTLREIVRQDPDIIVLGEIRDKTTAQVAIQAALTGHKVYSTFHTEDTIGGLLRLIDMEIETFLISSTVISVLAQRLLRRVCRHCAAPHTPGAREIEAAGLDVKEARSYEYRRGRGCNHCMYTGYRGRVGAYELLILNEMVKEAILQKRPAHEIRELSVETTGLVSMREDAIAKVVRGLTTYEEVVKHTPRTFALRPLDQIVSLCK